MGSTIFSRCLIGLVNPKRLKDGEPFEKKISPYQLRRVLGLSPYLQFMETLKYDPKATMQETEKSHQGTRILIVEDDVTMEALWRYIIDVAKPGAQLQWPTTGEAADHLLREGEKKGSDYDLVITDIVLGGSRTGLDLWETHSGSSSLFLLMSVLSPQRLSVLANPREMPLPIYLQKPLDPTQCIETIRALLPAAS